MKRAGRPPKPAGERKVTLSLRITPEHRDKLERLAEERQASMAQVIDCLIEEAKELPK